MRKFLTRATLAVLPITFAGAGLANNPAVDPGLIVNAISNTQFEVIEGRGEGARGIWCSASLYAVNTLGFNNGRLYIAIPSGPAQTVKGKKGVVFSTVPVGQTPKSVSVTVRRAGSNLPVIHALQFCNDYEFELP